MVSNLFFNANGFDLWYKILKTEKKGEKSHEGLWLVMFFCLVLRILLGR